MVLHASGTIFASQIMSEYNRNTSGTFFLGSSGRPLDSRVPQSGAINFSSFYNKYSRPQSGNLRVWLDAKEYSGSGTTWTDLQGNANGTLVNAPSFSRPYFNFNGTSQYVTLPDIDNTTDFTTSNNYTISCWVWVSSSQNFGDVDIVEKWDGNGGYPYVLRFYQANNVVGTAAYNPSPTSNPGASTPNNSIILNDWNHFSAVFNWSTLTISISVNGVLSVANSVANPGTITNSSLLYLMARGNPTNYVNGRLGMLMIHNVALNGAEVSRLYYSTRNVFTINSTEIDIGNWDVLYEYVNPQRNASNALVTSRDASATLGTKLINRVGYFMQNNMGNGSTTYWILVTMDAYTTTLSQLKIPDLVTTFVNQRNVTNLRIYSNHPQVGNYTAANGRLEIWPWNYAATSNLGGGSGTIYDFDDTHNGTGNYGSVQVHDITNSKTLLAWNRHLNTGTPDIGIGNNDTTNIHYTAAGGATDWTTAQNGAYNWKFQVLVGTIPFEPTILDSGAWRVVYELTNPTRTAGGALTFAVNNAATLGSPTFTRIGYYMQNNMGNGATSYWIFVSMNAYTSTLTDLRIPDITNAFVNQRNVTNLQVFSNHPQVGNYTVASGRLEIWPWNYNFTSNLGGGSNTVYDFDDTHSGNGDHGSVQVHDITNSKTLLAWNNHRSSQTPAIGIGNNDATNIHYNTTGGAAPNGSNPDWTFAANGAYNWKFQVLINNVALNPATLESGTWNLLYELTNPMRNADGMLVYAKNNAALLGDRQFTKVGYYMQNNMGNGATSYYAYVTMDAYTTSLRTLKIPDNIDAFINQRNVSNLNVYSNHPQVGNYTAANGRLEIWPYNYSGTTTFGDGNGATYDFDDTPSIVANGHGSVQVHDITNSKTILAWNRHGNGRVQDIGFGTNNVSNIHYVAGGAPDWTDAQNGNYNWKFQVFIKID
jgi:hypothetical protein